MKEIASLSDVPPVILDTRNANLEILDLVIWIWSGAHRIKDALQNTIGILSK